MTRREIIDQALQRAGNNTDSLRKQARIRLNRILQDLYLQWDWPFLWQTAAISLPPAATFPLPTGFVKPEDDHALTVDSAAGVAYGVPLQEVDHLAFAPLPPRP